MKYDSNNYIEWSKSPVRLMIKSFTCSVINIHLTLDNYLISPHLPTAPLTDRKITLNTTTSTSSSSSRSICWQLKSVLSVISPAGLSMFIQLPGGVNIHSTLPSHLLEENKSASGQNTSWYRRKVGNLFRILYREPTKCDRWLEKIKHLCLAFIIL